MKYLKEFSDKILLPETITVPRKDLVIAFHIWEIFFIKYAQAD